MSTKIHFRPHINNQTVLFPQRIDKVRIEYPGEKQKNKPPEIYRILRRFIRKEDAPYANYDTPSLLKIISLRFFLKDGLCFGTILLYICILNENHY